MKRFQLVRETDVTGISGTGVVAEGVEFTDGAAALRWTTHVASTAIYASLEDVVTIHGHNGSTWVKWLDGEDAWPDA